MDKVIELTDRTITIQLPDWTLRETLSHQDMVLNIVAEPLAQMGMMTENDDESVKRILMLEALKGAVLSISSVDICEVFDSLCTGSSFRTQAGIPKQLCIDELGADGVQMEGVYLILFEVIKKHYAPFFKSGIKLLMEQLPRMFPQEN